MNKSSHTCSEMIWSNWINPYHYVSSEHILWSWITTHITRSNYSFLGNLSINLHYCDKKSPNSYNQHVKTIFFKRWNHQKGVWITVFIESLVRTVSYYLGRYWIKYKKKETDYRIRLRFEYLLLIYTYIQTIII